jgi:hypothetical protein
LSRQFHELKPQAPIARCLAAEPAAASGAAEQRASLLDRESGPVRLFLALRGDLPGDTGSDSMLAMEALRSGADLFDEHGAVHSANSRLLRRVATLHKAGKISDTTRQRLLRIGRSPGHPLHTELTAAFQAFCSLEDELVMQFNDVAAMAGGSAGHLDDGESLFGSRASLGVWKFVSFFMALHLVIAGRLAMACTPERVGWSPAACVLLGIFGALFSLLECFFPGRLNQWWGPGEEPHILLGVLRNTVCAVGLYYLALMLPDLFAAFAAGEPVMQAWSAPYCITCGLLVVWLLTLRRGMAAPYAVFTAVMVGLVAAAHTVHLLLHINGTLTKK